MIKTPAQHQTDPEKLPGQVVNPIDYYQHPNGQWYKRKPEKTLGDYIENKQKEYDMKDNNEM